MLSYETFHVRLAQGRASLVYDMRIPFMLRGLSGHHEDRNLRSLGKLDQLATNLPHLTLLVVLAFAGDHRFAFGDVVTNVYRVPHPITPTNNFGVGKNAEAVTQAARSAGSRKVCNARALDQPDKRFLNHLDLVGSRTFLRAEYGCRLHQRRVDIG